MKINGKIIVLIVSMSLAFLSLPARADDSKEAGLGPTVERMTAAKTKSARSGFAIGLRFTGGLSFFDGGDINDTRSNVTLNEYLAGKEGVPYTINQQDINRSLAGGADLLFYLGKRFGIALGASYLGGKSHNRIIIELPIPPPSDYTITFSPKISAVPVTLGLFFTPPLGRRFNLLVEAGGGWTFARLAIDQAFIGGYGTLQANAQGKAGDPCVYARLGLEASIARHFSFFVEVLGLYAKINGFEGSVEVFHNGVIFDSGGGRFYTYDRDESGHPILFIDIADQLPSGASVSNVRSTEIDFSGVSARAGLRIRF